MLAANFGDGDVLLWFVEFFLFLIYIWLLIVIFGDLFRDRETSGWAKALWVLFILFAPLLGMLVYLIARGSGMGRRAHASAVAAQQSFDAYVRDAAATGQSPADQISRAKALLDGGTIDQAEFERLKAKALA
jgi:NADH:ubiquinone oxidoreductase subunit 4 (subunit M)